MRRKINTKVEAPEVEAPEAKSNYELAEEAKKVFDVEYAKFLKKGEEMLEMARTANLPNRTRYVQLMKSLKRNAKNLKINLN